jgi:hypothetical protein
MSLVTQGFKLTVTLVDSGGNKSTLRYELTAETFADATTDTATILAALNAVTDAVIVSYHLGEVFEEDAVSYAAEGVQVENVASIVARISTGDSLEKWTTIRIPAPNIGIFQAATGKLSNQVDAADAALITYLETWESGGEATISDGEVLADASTSGNVYGKRIHRASRKG